MGRGRQARSQQTPGAGLGARQRAVGGPHSASRLPWEGAEACAVPAGAAPRRLRGARAAAAVCGTSGGFSVRLLSASASERRESGMKTLFIPGYPSRPTLGSLDPSSLVSEWGEEGSLPGRGAVTPGPLAPAPLHRAASLGSDTKPLGQSLGRSCQSERPVCRGWGGGERLARPS